MLLVVRFLLLYKVDIFIEMDLMRQKDYIAPIISHFKLSISVLGMTVTKLWLGQQMFSGIFPDSLIIYITNF